MILLHIEWTTALMKKRGIAELYRNGSSLCAMVSSKYTLSRSSFIGLILSCGELDVS